MIRKTVFLFSLIFLVACGQHGNENGSGSSRAASGCDGACANESLSSADVELILSQGVASALATGAKATLAITDRVGNVLAVYQMTGASATSKIDGQIGAAGGLEGSLVPATLAAISKAGTGAYLSSQGNAFSTRTASQIIQEHFNPGESNQPAGPLFGVQFSQLLCSDVTVLNPELGRGSGGKFSQGGLVGPRPLPLGLSADPGGIPVYKNGDLVGGIGVELDGLYSLDRDITDVDDSPEERIALSATRGFEIPQDIDGSQIFAGGKSLRTTDLRYEDLEPLPEALPDINSAGSLVPVPFFSSGKIVAGAIFGQASSGILKSSRAGVGAGVLVDGAGNARQPTRAGSALPDGSQLTSTEVEALLDSSLVTASRLRAAIRTPRDTAARVTIWVVDHLGTALGMTRSDDAPVFGIDVSLQKARTAAFFSSVDAGQILGVVRAKNGAGEFDDYVGRLNSQVGGDILSKGYAFSARAVGNLARPFLLDGIDDSPAGPFSLPFPGKAPGRSFSPFNNGLQLDLVFQRLLQPLGVLGAASIPNSCTDSSVLGGRLRNGIQIFAGAVPLYRAGTLIGAIGISGDGIDQDDMVAFYGASRPGLDAVGHSDIGDPVLGFNAPFEIRSDQIGLNDSDTRLRYINCPEGPFSGSNAQKACSDL